MTRQATVPNVADVSEAVTAWRSVVHHSTCFHVKLKSLLSPRFFGGSLWEINCPWSF